MSSAKWRPQCVNSFSAPLLVANSKVTSVTVFNGPSACICPWTKVPGGQVETCSFHFTISRPFHGHASVAAHRSRSTRSTVDQYLWACVWGRLSRFDHYDKVQRLGRSYKSSDWTIIWGQNKHKAPVTKRYDLRFDLFYIELYEKTNTLRFMQIFDLTRIRIRIQILGRSCPLNYFHIKFYLCISLCPRWDLGAVLVPFMGLTTIWYNYSTIPNVISDLGKALLKLAMDQWFHPIDLRAYIYLAMPKWQINYLCWLGLRDQLQNSIRVLIILDLQMQREHKIILKAMSYIIKHLKVDVAFLSEFQAHDIFDECSMEEILVGGLQ